jgi:putative redox protein
VADVLEVAASWQGGYGSLARARGHEVWVDEPEAAGGDDRGMMPTELYCASLASCFCLALAHVARKRDFELPGLGVTVRARRAGRELRYDRFVVEATADVDPDRLAALMEPARRVCWVSNTIAQSAQYEYRHIGATPWASD